MAWDIGFDQIASSSSSSTSSSSSSSSSSLSSSSSSLSSSSSSLSSSSSSSSSSLSSSSSSTSPGTVVWGHQTGVTEDYARDLDGQWTDDQWSVSGTGDAEIIYTNSDCGQVSIGEDWYLGVMEAVITVDKYQTGSGPAPIIHYITAATKAGLAIGSWTLYDGVSFTSLGWIKLRITHV